jgi:mannose-6-phosphate isomerase-like protein (cupin superfamily)
MPSNTMALFSAAVLALSSVVSAAPHPRAEDDGLSLTAKLQLADNSVQRYDLLKDDDFIYTFSNETSPFADRSSFPALTGLGGSMAIAEFPPCAIGFLHLHPRASELFVVVSGTLQTEMVPEAGARTVKLELGANQMTVFPMGAFHTQFNPTCDPAVAVAGFTSDDPGAGLPVAGTFSLSDELVEAAFGGSVTGDEIDKIRAAIPQAMVTQRAECLTTCGDKKERSV